MSADSWADCPKCTKATEKLIEQAKAVYGKVTEEEYNDLRDKILATKPNKYTLREDYEIGIWLGKFEVYYSASCSKCDFEYSYNNSKRVKV
jgi:hypothetical protein